MRPVLRPLLAGLLAAASAAAAGIAGASHASAWFSASGEAVLPVGTAALAAPWSLTPSCTRTGNRLTIVMRWEPSALATSYDVLYRVAPDGPWLAGGSVGANQTTHPVSGLDRRQDHDLQVVAVRGAWTTGSAVLNVSGCA